MPDIKTIDNFEIDRDEPLGKGSSGQVFLGKDLTSGQRIAAKQILVKDVHPHLVEHAQQELISMKQTPPNPNVVRFLDSKQDGKYMWIFTEFCEHGDLDKYALKNKIATDQRFDIMVQVTKGIRHLHHLDPPIVHRDIKPGNIVLTEVDGKIIAKLCDFGIAKPTEHEGGFPKSFHTFCGTHKYLAPELFQQYHSDEVTYDMSVDIYSTGIFFYAFIEAGDNEVLQPPQSKDFLYKELSYNAIIVLINIKA